MRIKGTVCPLPTPTVGNGEDIDERALSQYTEFLLDGGVHGLFPCGSIGEFSSLQREQRRQVIETVSEHADVPVLAGCGDTSVKSVRQNVRDAANVGADAAVIVTPYYLSTTQDGLEDFFRAIADDSTLPVYLYNIPALTGDSLSVDLLVSLADHPNIYGLKDTSGDLTFLRETVTRTPESFTVLQGASELAVASLDFEANGLIAGPANVFPEAMATLYDAYRSGNRTEAVSIMNEVTNPVVSATRPMPTASAIKHLVRCAGYDIGGPLPPLPQLTKQQKTSLEQCYENVSMAIGEQLPSVNRAN
jgi:4-hydroxy-tetrahydrodipicolinate synthase